MVRRLALAVALAIPIWFGLSLVCYVAFCLTAGPWGGAMDSAEASDVPRYLPWMSRLLAVLIVVASLGAGWRWAGRLTRPNVHPHGTMPEA